MAWSYLTGGTGFNASSGGASNAVASGINTTGATLIVVSGVNSGTFSDSKSNTWQSIHDSSSGYTFWYCINPITSSSHSFTLSAPTNGAIAVAAFSGGSSSTILDQHSTAHGNNVTTISPSSITPTQANELLIFAGFSSNSGTTSTIAASTGWNEIQSVQGEQYAYPTAVSYIIQTTPTAQGGTYTFHNSGTQVCGVLASFTLAGSSGVFLTPMRGILGPV